MTESDPSFAADRPRLQLAVVLPTLNERKNLRKLVARLDEALVGIGWEAIFVDDNSPDGTADEARAINQEDPRIRVIQRIGRRGLATAAIEGMCATAAPVVAVMDADHQHDPKLLRGMLEAIESGDYDLAYASRFAEGASTEAWGRPDRVKASGFANALARKVTGVDLSDPMSGYFMLRGETLRADAHRLSGVGFKILLDILATVDNPLRVKEFPLNFAAREEGKQAGSHRRVRISYRSLRQVAWPHPAHALCAVRHGGGAGRDRAVCHAVAGADGHSGRAVQIRPLGRRCAHLQHRQHHRRGDGDDVQLRAEQLADLCRQASARVLADPARLVPVRVDLLAGYSDQCGCGCRAQAHAYQ
jgi:hypothetical protein